MTTRAFCNICDRQVDDDRALFLLRKHGIAVSVTVNTWGVHEKRTGSNFSFGGQSPNHICHRCLLDIVRTGTPDPNGWSKEDVVELKIGNVVGMK